MATTTMNPTSNLPNPRTTLAFLSSSQSDPHSRHLPSSHSSHSPHSSFTPSRTMAAVLHPIPNALLDDPAFSSDPDSNPLFSMSPPANFLPTSRPPLDLSHSYHARAISAPEFPSSPPSNHLPTRSDPYDSFQSSQSVHANYVRRPPFHPLALPPPRASSSRPLWSTFRPFDEDPIDMLPLAASTHPFRELGAPAFRSRGPPDVSPPSSTSSSPITPPLSLESASSSATHSSYSHSSQSHSSQSSHSSHSSSSSQQLPSRKFPPADPTMPFPPLVYPNMLPPTDRSRLPSSSFVPPREAPLPSKSLALFAQWPSTAPPLHHDLQPVPLLETRKPRTRKQSATTPPGGLDKIDELDETDPLGFAWHHDSRYEAVTKTTVSKDRKGTKAAKLIASENLKGHKKAKASHLDPNAVSFSISPGQIFPAFNHYHPQPTVPSVSSTLAPSSQSQHQRAFPPLMHELLPTKDSTPSSSQHSPAILAQSLAQPPHRTSPHRLAGDIPGIAIPQSGVQAVSLELVPARSSPNGHPSTRPSTPPRHRFPQMPQEMMVAGGASTALVPGTPSANSAALPARLDGEGTHSAPLQQLQQQPPFQDLQADVSAMLRPTSSQNPRLSSNSSRNRAPPPGLPPRLLQQQRLGAIPKPDIVLPPRHQAAKMRASQHQPHYLPKRLVMPAPLQPLQAVAQQPIQGASSFGSVSSTSTPGASMSMGGDHLALRHGVPDLAGPVQRKKAKDIPVSHGRNLLRKRIFVPTGGDPPAAAVEYVDHDSGAGPIHTSAADTGGTAKHQQRVEWKKDPETQKVGEKEKDKGKRLSKRR